MSPGAGCDTTTYIPPYLLPTPISGPSHYCTTCQRRTHAGLSTRLHELQKERKKRDYQNSRGDFQTIYAEYIYIYVQYITIILAGTLRRRGGESWGGGRKNHNNNNNNSNKKGPPNLCGSPCCFPRFQRSSFHLGRSHLHTYIYIHAYIYVHTYTQPFSFHSPPHLHFSRLGHL